MYLNITSARKRAGLEWWSVILIAFCAAIFLSVKNISADTATAQKFTQEIPGATVSFEMIKIPAGEISINDPAKPGQTRKVKVDSIYICKTETTWEMYDAFSIWKQEEGKPANGADAVSRPSRPYGSPDRGYGHQGYPAISVTSYGAGKFCEWLSLKTGRKYRLPSEVEWEYAARAGKPEPGKGDLAKVAWYFEEKTQPVAKKTPNAWGLYDTLGNVGEWAIDLDGKPVLCGGNWQDTTKNIKVTARAYQTPDWQITDPQNPKGKWWLSDGPFVGFRIVCEAQ